MRSSEPDRDGGDCNPVTSRVILQLRENNQRITVIGRNAYLAKTTADNSLDSGARETRTVGSQKACIDEAEECANGCANNQTNTPEPTEQRTK